MVNCFQTNLRRKLLVQRGSVGVHSKIISASSTIHTRRHLYPTHFICINCEETPRENIVTRCSRFIFEIILTARFNSLKALSNYKFGCTTTSPPPLIPYNRWKCIKCYKVSKTFHQFIFFFGTFNTSITSDNKTCSKLFIG